MSAGVALTYFSIKVSFWLVLVTYGLMFGVGMGVSYTAPLAVAMKWMPRWKGVASGVVVSGFGLGALAFSPVQTLYINPSNIPPVPDPYDENQNHFTDLELLQRIPSMFLILGATFAVMQLIGVLLIADPPSGYLTDLEPNTRDNEKEKEILNDEIRIHEVDDVQLLPCCERNNLAMLIVKERKSTSSSDDEIVLTKSPRSHSPVLSEHDLHSSTIKTTILSDDESEPLLQKHDGGIAVHESDDHSKQVKESSSLRDGYTAVSLTPLQMLKRPNFYILWLMLLCNGTAVVFTSTNYKFFGNSFIPNDHFLATVSSVSSIFNCLGRIAWGMFSDKASYRFAIVLLSATMAVFFLTFYACVSGGEAMFFIWVCVIFFCIGGNYSVFPSSVAKAYGLKYVAANYGVLFTSQIIAGVLGATVSSTLITYVGYVGLLFIVAGFSCVGFLLVLIYRAKIYLVKFH